MNDFPSFSGTVISGNGYGRKLGFPTANISQEEYWLLPEVIRPKEGIYAGEVSFSGQRFKSAIVVGPKIEENTIKLEAHLLEFSGNLYGQKLTFHLHAYLRPFQEYSSERLLQQAIRNDVLFIHRL